MTRFSSLELSPDLLAVVDELGYAEMTPIQERSIPLLLQGKDLIGQSKTGSGKTAAFSLPILQKIDPKSRRIQALVLSPTRELCTQVAREIRKLARRHAGLQVLILSGGEPIGPQLGALKKGAHVVVGTPGRLVDHLNRKSLDLASASTLVLDEADRMLEMGFEEDLRRILEATPAGRQTVLFSATFPRAIEKISRAYQRDPERVTISEETPVNADIRQLQYAVETGTSPEDAERAKLRALLWILAREKPGSAMVFVNLKATAASLARGLQEAGVSCDSLHGDLAQEDRNRVMAKFRGRSTRVLVATDVAARGIDVESLDLVVNFDLPKETEVYVHRIGRTGRAGRSGLAIALAGSREGRRIKAIESYTGIAMERGELPPPGELEREIERSAETLKTDLRAEMRTIYISGGRKEKVRPGDIMGALTGEAGGLHADDVGKIEIHDRFSYVAVARKIAQTALNRLRDGRIKGRKFRIEPVR